MISGIIVVVMTKVAARSASAASQNENYCANPNKVTLCSNHAAVKVVQHDNYHDDYYDYHDNYHDDYHNENHDYRDDYHDA